LYKEIIAPFGHTLGGTIKWRGEDFDDMGKIIVDQYYITADGHKSYDCTPDPSPRFIECLKAGMGKEVSLPLPFEKKEVDRLLDHLEDIADHVEGRSKVQANNIRETVKKIRVELSK